MSVPAAYIGVIVIWSTTPLAIAWSGDGVGFLFGLTARMVLGLAACVLVMVLMRVEFPLDRQARLAYLAGGLGLFGAMLSVYWASRHIPSGWISVVFGLSPLATGVMAAIWLGERALTPVRVAAMLLGVTGLGIIFHAGDAVGPDAAKGIAGVLVSVLIHSASVVAVKRVGARVPALAMSTGGLAVAVPLYLVVLLAAGDPWPDRVPPRAGAAIVYLAMVGSVLGFALYFHVLRHVEATRVSLIALMTPVLALLLGAALNGEPVRTDVWVGTAAILSALLIYEVGGAPAAGLRRLASVLRARRGRDAEGGEAPLHGRKGG